MMELISLDRLPVGESGCVEQICCGKETARRLRDLGLVENTWISCLGQSPSGDPRAYQFRGTVVALRNADCRGIIIGRRSQLWAKRQ